MKKRLVISILVALLLILWLPSAMLAAQGDTRTLATLNKPGVVLIQRLGPPMSHGMNSQLITVWRPIL